MDRSYIPYSSHGGDYSMNSRRLVRLLQAVSYDIPDRGHSVPRGTFVKQNIHRGSNCALFADRSTDSYTACPAACKKRYSTAFTAG